MINTSSSFQILDIGVVEEKAKREFPCVRITYQGNVICVDKLFTREQNLEYAKSVLTILLGYNPFLPDIKNGGTEFDMYGGKIEYYHSS